MKAVVCVKHVPDITGVDLAVHATTQLDLTGATWNVNDADTYAVEEALRLRDTLGSGEVIVATVGTADGESTLRRCMAMGADRAIRVEAEGAELSDPLVVARALAAAIAAESPDIVLCGVLSSDDGNQSTGPALASALEWPSVCVVTSVMPTDSASRLEVRREFEGGTAEVLSVELPAVLTIQSGPNEPRYGTFKDNMRAKKFDIPIVEVSPAGGGGHIRRVVLAESERTGESSEVIEGGPMDIARCLLALVREAQP